MKPWTITMSLICAFGAGVTAAAEPGVVDDWLRQHQQSGQIAAAALAEIRADQIHARGYGQRSPVDATMPNAQTQFQIGSITKVYTLLLLAELVEADIVRDTSTIGEWMPASFRPRNPAVASITLRSLATHTSGLPRLPANLDLGNTVDPYAGYDQDALHAGLSQARDQQPLGRFYTYSNFAVGALGHLLGRADQRDYRQSLTARVITPMRLRNTAFEPGDNAAAAIVAGKPVPAWGFTDALAASGALWGSVEDLARLVQIYLGTHEHDLQHDLKRGLKIAVTDADGFEVTPIWHVARAGGEPIYWHNGGTAGFHSFVGFRPDQQRGMAILVSGDVSPTAIGLQALGHHDPETTAYAGDRSIFGQYQINERFGIGVFEHEGVLAAQASGQSPFAIHAVGDGWYSFGDIDSSVRFVREDGAVVALELVQNGITQSAKRVADVATATTRREIAIDVTELDAYTGSYAFAPGVALTVRRSDDGIEAQLTGQPYFPVHARAPDRFFYKVVDAELQFERDAGGKVSAVILHQGGIEQRAPRSD